MTFAYIDMQGLHQHRGSGTAHRSCRRLIDASLSSMRDTLLLDNVACDPNTSFERVEEPEGFAERHAHRISRAGLTRPACRVPSVFFDLHVVVQ